MSGNEARGSGSHSRIALDFEKLRQAGWQIIEEKRTVSTGVKVYFRYTNPSGKSVKSSKDVERQLKAEGNYDSFVCDSISNEELEPKSKTSGFATSDDDADYEPPEKQTLTASKDEW